MLLSWRDWVFSAKAFLASMMALYIALWFDLPRPYWAMAAVYVVANPLAGVTSSKGLYRALGTLIGASAAVIFVPLFVNAPELLSLVVALWTGCLLYISMLDRTPRSYVFMLAGYSLPLIALPAVGAPETIFDVALARTEEIIIGITCATLVGMVVFPTSVSTVLGARISSWLDDAAEWADEILRGEGAVPATPEKRQKLASDIAGLDLVISQLSYDAGTRDITQHARELRGRLMMLLPLFSSLADRLHALQAQDGCWSPQFGNLLSGVASWIRSRQSSDEELAGQLDAIDRLESSGQANGWDALIRASAFARLREIVNLWHDCMNLQGQISLGRHKGPWRPAFRHRQVIGRARHYDYAMMLFQCGSVVAATLLASFIWIGTGWQSGAGFVMMTAVACSFFASLDQPAPLILKMFVWCTVSLVLSFVYLFGILPAVNSYEMLVLVFAPPFLVLGALIPHARFNMLAMLMTVNTASFIALQNRFSADFIGFANEAVGAICGVGLALIWTYIARPFGAEISARRLVQAGWADLAATASGQRRSDHEKLSSRMLDRLGQLVPRLAALDNRYISEVDGFAEVRIGFNILSIQGQMPHLLPAERRHVARVLTAVAGLYRQRAARRTAVKPQPELLGLLDMAMASCSGRNAAGAAAVLDALVGLRRILFPYAPPPAGYDAPDISERPALQAAE
jgi:uncharacterized membrane protein YccC